MSYTRPLIALLTIVTLLTPFTKAQSASVGLVIPELIVPDLEAQWAAMYEQEKEKILIMALVSFIVFIVIIWAYGSAIELRENLDQIAKWEADIALVDDASDKHVASLQDQKDGIHFFENPLCSDKEKSNIKTLNQMKLEKLEKQNAVLEVQITDLNARNEAAEKELSEVRGNVLVKLKEEKEKREKELAANGEIDISGSLAFGIDGRLEFDDAVMGEPEENVAVEIDIDGPNANGGLVVEFGKGVTLEEGEIDANVEIEVDVEAGANVELDVGADANVEIEVDANVDAEVEVEVDAEA